MKTKIVPIMRWNEDENNSWFHMGTLAPKRSGRGRTSGGLTLDKLIRAKKILDQGAVKHEHYRAQLRPDSWLSKELVKYHAERSRLITVAATEQADGPGFRRRMDAWLDALGA
jgi:hypothetical protein